MNTLFKKKKVSLIGSKFIKYYKKKLRKNKNNTNSTGNKNEVKETFQLNQKTLSFDEQLNKNKQMSAVNQDGGNNETWYKGMLNNIKEFVKDNYGFLILIILIVVLLYVRYIEVLKKKEKINKIKKHFIKEEGKDDIHTD